MTDECGEAIRALRMVRGCHSDLGSLRGEDGCKGFRPVGNLPAPLSQK